MEWMSNLFEQYGYLVLLIGLFAESIALPFPGELAMAISGHMSTVGHFPIPLIIGYSYFGAIMGTIVSYYLGHKLGTPLFEKYGRFLFLNEERMRKITKWFDKYGDKIIFVSYFIPGLRHFTGYVSGILKIRLRTFLIYNLTGGFLWVLAYVMVGKIFGAKIEQFLHILSQYSIPVIIVLVVGVVLGFLIKRNKNIIMEWIRIRSSLK
jgi:membrane protein DedA with SNARE-associated domain